MTIGIYRLIFPNTDKCYIGQSVNIERRYMQHLRSFELGRASGKLQSAYDVYGKPKLDVLLDDIDLSELDSCENEAIEIFDSVANGFNTYQEASQAPSTSNGVDAPNAKFTKDQILNVFNLLVYSSKQYPEISDITGVTVGVISSIQVGRNHSWLSEEYPNEYSILLNKIGARSNFRASVDKQHYLIVSNKLSAKSRGIVYPKIRSHQGEVFVIDNAYAFAKAHGLAGNHFQEVLNGHRKSHKGWRLNE